MRRREFLRTTVALAATGTVASRQIASVLAEELVVSFAIGSGPIPSAELRRDAPAKTPESGPFFRRPGYQLRLSAYARRHLLSRPRISGHA